MSVMFGGQRWTEDDCFLIMARFRPTANEEVYEVHMDPDFATFRVREMRAENPSTTARVVRSKIYH